MSKPTNKISDPVALVKEVLRDAGLAVPALLLAAAIGVYGVAVKAKEVAQVAKEMAVSDGGTSAKLDKQYLAEADYRQQYEIFGRTNPAVKFQLSPDKKGLVVSVGDTQLFPEWLYALYSLQSYSKNVLWEATDICLAKCGDGSAAQAVIKAYSQSIKLN